MQFWNEVKTSCNPIEMVFCRVGDNFLQMVLNYANEQVYKAFWVIKQGTIEKVKVYYERILKLVNYLQHKVDDSLLTIFFRAGLITYLKVVIVSMKCNSLFEHKEVVVIYEESMGDPIEYQKLLEPSKLDINNDGKHTNLVCS
jgi:hypothetical protein